MKTPVWYISALVLAGASGAAAQVTVPVAPPPAVRDTSPPPVPAIGPPIRKISTATAVSTEPLGAVTSVVQLSDGRVLLNDGIRRRLLVLDTALKLQSVVLDSMAESSGAYGVRAGAIFAYRGDSVVFIDPSSYAMLIIDPSMKIVRVRSVPRAQDVYNLTIAPYGYPGFDDKGRLVFRMYAQPSPPKVKPPEGVPYWPQEPDSAFITAIDLDTRKMDTLGVIRLPKSTTMFRQTAEGYFSINSSFNPLPLTDEWAVMPDGRVAFVRARDYRIEWRQPDGTMKSSEKIPFDWQRMVEEDKQRMIDSVRKAQTKTYEASWVSQVIRWSNTYARPYPKTFKVPEGYVLQPGMPKDWILPEGVKFPPNYVFACAPGQTPNAPANVAGSLTGPPPAAGAPPASTTPAAPTCIPAPPTIAGGNAPPPPTMRDVFVIPPEDLPDYKPPFAALGVRADGDGNLWVKTIPPKPVPGGPVYDIINSAGELVDRLQIPTGYTLVGFGKGKVVYLSVRDATGLHLAKVRLK